MLEWFKKDDSIAENAPEKTNNISGNSEEEMLAVLFNKKLRRGVSKVPATIGKNPNAADVSFFHSSVDNVHCTIDCQGGQFTIMDNGSREGTQINKQKLEPGVPYIVNNGDHITFGKVEFELIINRIPGEDQAADIPAEPEEKTYTIKARPVLSIEYDESEVVYISCGLEPEAKKAAYTQEIKSEQIREAMRAAEEKKAEEMPARNTIVEGLSPEAAIPHVQTTHPVFVPEPDAAPVMPVEPKPVPAEPVRYDPDKAMILTCIKGFGVGEEILIDHFPFRIGRSKSNDYILRIDKISREHARFTERNGMYYITDANSTNGIRVNGIRIDMAIEYRITEGDTITLSDNVYRVGFPNSR